MQITMSVVLSEGESPGFTAEEAAAKTLEALGGDPESDHCSCSLMQTAHGEAGSQPVVAATGEPPPEPVVHPIDAGDGVAPVA